MISKRHDERLTLASRARAQLLLESIHRPSHGSHSARCRLPRGQHRCRAAPPGTPPRPPARVPAAVSNSTVKFCASSRLDRGESRSDQRYSPVSLRTIEASLLNSGSEARTASGTSTVSPATRRAITEAARCQRVARAFSAAATRLTKHARQLARHASCGVSRGRIRRFEESSLRTMASTISSARPHRAGSHSGIDSELTMRRNASPARYLAQRHAWPCRMNITADDGAHPCRSLRAEPGHGDPHIVRRSSSVTMARSSVSSSVAGACVAGSRASVVLPAPDIPGHSTPVPSGRHERTRVSDQPRPAGRQCERERCELRLSATTGRGVLRRSEPRTADLVPRTRGADPTSPNTAWNRDDGSPR